MNSKTKIIVIHMKELIIGAVIAVALIILLVVLIVSLSSKSDNNAKTPDNDRNAASNTLTNTYTPGVYSSSLSINGSPVDIQVTVDSNSITNIKVSNLSDTITTMYPYLQETFDSLTEKVVINGSTENIAYEAENKYTSTMFLNAIRAALDQAVKK